MRLSLNTAPSDFCSIVSAYPSSFLGQNHLIETERAKSLPGARLTALAWAPAGAWPVGGTAGSVPAVFLCRLLSEWRVQSPAAGVKVVSAFQIPAAGRPRRV